MTAEVRAFFDAPTNTISYVVADPVTGRAAIIDPVLDYDAAAGRTATTAAEAMIGWVGDRGLTVDWILETHVHADHLTAAPYLRDRLGGVIAIGRRVCEVQATFKPVFNLAGLATDGSQFDRLFDDGDRFGIGELDARVMTTPGHTPACVTYLIDDAAFVGDTLFMPDYGSARCDFPGGDAGQLFDSIQRLFALPDATRMFLCHDYKAPGRDEFAWETTVATQRDSNVHVGGGTTRDDFVAMREGRDATLSMPNLILPAIQVNAAAGQLPPPEDNGIAYLRIPLNAV